MSDIAKKLSAIQSELVAPKNQRNTFGNYNFRSCEDIVEAVKPLLKKHGLVLLMSDEIVEVGGRVYVKASACLRDSIIKEGELSLGVHAYAREPESQKGMSDAQLTGATSSYARKYALNGLFAIDDTKDADTNEHKIVNDAKKALGGEELVLKIKKEMDDFTDLRTFEGYWKAHGHEHKNTLSANEFKVVEGYKNQRKEELT